MATLARRDTTTGNTTNGATYDSASFTPTVGDLLVVFCSASATLTDAATLTASANSLTFTRVLRQQSGGSSRKYIFVADQLVPSSPSAMIVTLDVTGDNATGAGIVVMAAVGMTKTGSTAVRQVVGPDDNSAGGGTPATVTFDSAPLTTNPVLCHGMTNQSTPDFNPPTGWTEYADLNYATPNSNYSVAGIESGFTSTAVTTDGNMAAGALSAIELDASSGGTSHALTASGATTTTGAAAVAATRVLTGSGATSTTGAAGMVVLARLTASGSATTGGAAALTRTAPLAASGSATTSGAAAIDIDSPSPQDHPLTASGTTTTGGAAALVRVATLAATGSAATNGVATPQRRAVLTATGTASTTGSAAPALRAVLTASGTATTGGAAAIAIGALELSASGSVTTTGSATLTRQAPLFAAGTATTTGNAALTRIATLSAEGMAETFGAAELTALLVLVAAGEVTATGTAQIALVYPFTPGRDVALSLDIPTTGLVLNPNSTGLTLDPA